MISAGSTKHWIIEQSEKQPGKNAVILEDRIITYGELADECFAAAEFMIDNGICKGDRIAVLFSHNYNFLTIINALWIIGAVPVPISTQLLPAELEKQINKVEIKFLIFDEKTAAQYSELSFPDKIHFPFRETKDHIVTNPEKHNVLRSADYSPLDPSLIMFTSGSTGDPKAVVHTFRSLYQSVKATDSFAMLSDDDIWFSSLPLFHIGGFMILIRSLISGSALVFPSGLRYENIVAGIRQFRPTCISLVPTMLHRLLKNNFSPASNLRFLFLGGGPSEEQLYLDAIDRGWPVVKVYGSTETCSMVTALPATSFRNYISSSGKPLGQNRIMIQHSLPENDEANSMVPESGEIYIASDSLFKEYYKDFEATAGKIINGWYHTGDLGRIDNNGYLFVESRREDLIITGGENVSCAEVENAISTFPGVSDVYVFSLEDSNWGQIVCAAVECADIKENDLKKFLKTKLAGYKIPKRIFQLAILPRNEMGKIIRPALLKELNLD
ncbi:MAG: o-succinylbenzoate--CoA ligase [Melioribacteraceae bacterium]